MSEEKKENLFLDVSQEAADYIQSIMTRHQDAAGLFLTIKVTGCSGLSVVPEVVFSVPEHAVRCQASGVVFFIDQAYASVFEGTQIKIEHKDLGQKQLHFINPHAEAECGCGESFTIPKDVMDLLMQQDKNKKQD